MLAQSRELVGVIVIDSVLVVLLTATHSASGTEDAVLCVRERVCVRERERERKRVRERERKRERHRVRDRDRDREEEEEEVLLTAYNK